MSAVLALAPEPVRARLLLRISKDRNDLRHGVDRQLAVCSEWAARNGWEIDGQPHRDNNLSGWKEGVERPAFNALVADIKAGQVRAVLAYDQSRITRQSAEWGAFRRLCKKHGVRVAFAADGGEVAIGSASGHMSTGLRALLDEGESEVKSQRCRDTTDERVQQDGKTVGRVLYGWKRVNEENDRGVRVAWHDEPHPEQAAVVRELVRRVAAGESLHKLADELNQRGVPTATQGYNRPGAKVWTNTTVRTLVQRPANVGQVRYRGQVVQGVQAAAPALVDVALWTKACNVLADPARRTVSDHRIKSVVTGVVRCGVCGGPLRTRNVKRQGGATRQRTYICAEGSHVAMDAARLDKALAKAVVAVLRRLRLTELAGASDAAAAAAQAEVDRLTEYRRELIKGAAKAGLGGGTLTALLAEVDKELAAAQAKARTTVAGPGAAAALGVGQDPDPAAAWAALPLAVQRTILADVLDLRLRKAQPGEHPQAPARLLVGVRGG